MTAALPCAPLVALVFATWTSSMPQQPAPAARSVHDASGHEYAVLDGRLRVPENRAKPAGRTIELAYARVRSPAAEPGPPLVFLNGGPGQPATPIADDPATLEEWRELLARADVVFLDQRGTGRSTPSLALAFDESLPEDFFLDVAAARAYFLGAERRAREHFQAQGIELAAYDVVESADDVEAVRAALGVEQIDVLGYSFGTVLATAALRRHPEHVRRAVLVGTETAEEWGSLPTLLETQIEKLACLAAADPGVNHAVPDMAELLARVLDRLEREPLFVEVEDRRTGERVTLPLGRFGLEFLLRIDLGDGNDFPYFPALLWSLDQGRTDLVRPLLEKRYDQLARGVSAMADTMRASYGPPAWLRARFAAESGACLLREVVNYFDLDLAEAWGVEPSASLETPLVCRVPALFVSGTLDSNAPPYQAEKLRYGFLDSAHLIVDYAGHEDLLPDPEVRRVIARFLAGEDVRAARVERAPPRFVAIRKQG
jgi:pimeloyl-ACP methyl ester carboxylesterase